MIDAHKMKIQYSKLTMDLLDWIKLKIIVLEDRNFPNSLEGIKREFLALKQYGTIEKPKSKLYTTTSTSVSRHLINQLSCPKRDNSLTTSSVSESSLSALSIDVRLLYVVRYFVMVDCNN